MRICATMETTNFTGEIAALATAFCWVFTAMAFESAGKKVGSLSVNFIRLVIASFFLMAYGWITRGRPLPTDASGHAWLWLSLSGVIGFAIGDLCLFRALVVIGARLSMLLMSLVPPLTAVLGWFTMGENLTGFEWLGMALTVSGVVWVILERTPNTDGEPVRLPLSGILLGIGGAAGQAVGLVMSKIGMGEFDPFAATQIRIFAGIASFALLFVFIRWWPRVLGAFKNKSAMMRIGLGGFFGPFLGVSLSLLAVKYTEAGVAATIMAIVPVLIIVPAVFIHKEKISPRAILGAVVAVSGVGMMFL